jgi:hypothetical protein
VLAEPSSIATEMQSCTGPFTTFLPVFAAAPDLPGKPRLAGNIPFPAISGPDPGLLHDAGSLMSVVGLYCDLLAAPGVLQPRHRKYAEDLRLVGTLSEAMLGRLMEQLARGAAEDPGAAKSGSVAAGSVVGEGVSC